MMRILIAFSLFLTSAFACELLTPTQFSGVIENKALYSVYGAVNNPKDHYYEVKVFETKGPKGEAFRKRLAQHTSLMAKTLKPLGQLAYITYANDHQNFSLAIWKSKSAREDAYKGKGAPVKKDQESFMKEVITEEVNRDYYPVSFEYINYQFGRTKNSGLKAPHAPNSH